MKNENVLNITNEDIEEIKLELYGKGGRLEDLSDIQDLQCYHDDRPVEEIAREQFEIIYGRKPKCALDRTWQGFLTAYQHLRS